jgi:hypothetical protein
MTDLISGFFNSFASVLGYKDQARKSIVSSLLGEEDDESFFDKYNLDYFTNQPVNIIGKKNLIEQQINENAANNQTTSLNQNNTNTNQTTTPLSGEDIRWSNLPLAISGFDIANRGKGDIKKIVLHETLGETTEAGVRTLKERGLSYHTIVDKDGTATKYVDPKNIAWGAKGVNKDSINISAAHTESDHDIKASQQDTFEKLIRKYIQDYYNGEPIEVSYHGQHGGTDCNVFGTHAAYEQWMKTRLGDLLQTGKIKLSNSQNTVNQPNEQGTRILTENGKSYNTVV